MNQRALSVVPYIQGIVSSLQWPENCTIQNNGCVNAPYRVWHSFHLIQPFSLPFLQFIEQQFFVTSAWIVLKMGCNHYVMPLHNSMSDYHHALHYYRVIGSSAKKKKIHVSGCRYHYDAISIAPCNRVTVDVNIIATTSAV